MIKAIIFDFYGVICRDMGDEWYSTRLSAESVPELKIKYDKPSDLGKITGEDFFAGIGSLVGSSGSTVREEWLDLAVINQDLVDLTAELGKQYTLAICSNGASKLFREILKKHDLERLFEIVVSSSEVGMVKPSPEIFNYTLEQLNVLPQEAIFVDDREENVKGAGAVGIRSLVYRDIKTLEKDLEVVLK